MEFQNTHPSYSSQTSSQMTPHPAAVTQPFKQALHTQQPHSPATNPKTWESYNDFLMYGDKSRFAKFLSRYELFKKIIDLPGDIVEGGVFKGAGVLFWAKLIEIFNPNSTKKVIGFDTFSGYVNTGNKKDLAAGQFFIQDANYDNATPESIMAVAKEAEVAHRVVLVKGDASVTMKEYIEKNPGFRIALLNLDYDVYEPTKAALENLYKRVVPQGIVIFDEYAVHKWSESDAVDEFLRNSEGKDIVLKNIPWGDTPSAYFEKKRM